MKKLLAVILTVLAFTAIPASQAQAGAVIRLGDVTLVLGGGDNCNRGYNNYRSSQCAPPPRYTECRPRRCEPPRCDDGNGYRNNNSYGNRYNNNNYQPYYQNNYRNNNDYDPKGYNSNRYSYGR